MFVMEERTEECQIPYVYVEYHESALSMAKTLGSTPTYTAHANFAKKVTDSYSDQEAIDFELYRGFCQSFQANSRTVY